MIIYKAEDINNTIGEMGNNIKGILDKSESNLSSSIDKYRSEKQKITNNDQYTQTGKKETSNQLSIKYCEQTKRAGEKYIEEIEQEYDSAIERVTTLTQYDSEAKTVQESKVDRVKENTDLAYTIQVLNNIDDPEETGILKELFEKYQDNEKIINLIKLKANKLTKNGVDSQALNQVRETIKSLDTDYIEQLKNEKIRKISNFRNSGYPSNSFNHNLEKIYEVSIGKTILDFVR